MVERNGENEMLDIEPVEINETTNLAELDEPEKKPGRGLFSVVAKGLGQAAGAVEQAAGVIGEAAGTVATAAAQTPQLIQDTAGNVAEAAGEKMLQVLLDHYKPIKPEVLYDPDFDIPNLIVIEDGDKRKGIEVCEGEVAWLSLEQKMEVLHLYEDEVPQFGIRFYPMPKLGAAYFKDTYDPTRYIDVANYVDVMEKDYITELRDVAYHLGAKSCRLEVSQKIAESETTSRKGGLKVDAKVPSQPGVKAGASGESEASSSMQATRDIRFSETFEGDAEPVRPELVRLQHDREIEHLINTRCSSARKNTLTNYSYEIKTSELICISEAMAAKLDAAVKGVGAGGANASLSSKVSREMHKKMLFVIEF